MNRIRRMIIFILCIILVSSCSTENKESSTNDLISEGEDTKISVIGYTDFKNEDSYFLKKGDKIAVIAPSALPGGENVRLCMEGLKEWGYEPVEGKYVSVEQRTIDECIEDLKWALEDPDIAAIFCVRGGHASSEVLDVLPLSLIEKADKPIIGFSDITTYLSAWTKAGKLSLHSSMVHLFSGLPEECVEPSRKLMEGLVPVYECKGSRYDIQGSAEGILIGGNLATYTSVIDTPYDSSDTDEPYILFFEDVAEDYEHIHRFLTILKHQGVLDKAEALIFGEWIEYPEFCETYNGNSRGG
ncbi:MAG: LD-carboxypeptidase, partial [Erysipelotrichaceae bacterium]|nr:LD-carboxypeptidase [Erysipelotrichaceae bacterium]